MAIASSEQDTAAERLFDFPSEQLIAVGRIFLTVFALIAVMVEGPPSSSSGGAIYTILTAYVGFAILQGAYVLGRRPSAGQQLFAHAFDLVAVSVLMALTEGPTSPFFVFFTFILLASTVRWNWRGALATAALLIAAYAGLVVLLRDAPGDPNDVVRAVIRAAFLMVAGAMLGYVGAYRDRSRHRLAQLVAWPGPDRTAKAAPPIAGALAHAAELLRAPRVLVIWEQPEEPFRQVALYSDGQVQHSRGPTQRFGSLVAPGQEAATFLVDLPSEPQRRAAPPKVDPDLCRTFGIRKALTAPFQRDLCRGRIFALDPSSSTDDDLLMVELIASRIGVDLEHHLLRQQIQTAAALRERERLGRDLHDGVLQTLAAANLQLKLSARHADAAVEAKLEETRSLLADEQQRVRRFVEDHRPMPVGPVEEISIADAVAQRLRDLGRQWRCEVECEVSPPDLRLPPVLARHVRHLLAEAVSNAARHGPAKRVRIALQASQDVLAITISDDGRGFRGLSGGYSDTDLQALNLGPASLRSRVDELGGTLQLETSPTGSRIEVRLPR
ncbi:MAG TPA: sensor histidine kinase [Microvirga sp.]|nr:sensor histidine kinase [Microvirga sp.]